MKFWIGIRISVLVVIGLFAVSSAPAQALTAELAKACRDKALKDYPQLSPGGRTTNAQQQRDAFRACVQQASNSAPSTSGSGQGQKQ